MQSLDRFLARILNVLRPGRAERELDREIASHLQLLEDDFIARGGMTQKEASLAARRAYGKPDLARELHREERSFVWLEQWVRDFYFAARGLLRTPGFTFVAVATLALGVGVNATLFSAYNALVLRPLPVADPDRVVRFERWFESRGVGNRQYLFSFPEYLYCRDHQDAFADLVAASPATSVPAKWGDDTRSWSGQLVTANYFPALGVGARIGRTFLNTEDRSPGGDPVLVISSRAWKRWFDNDPGILGRVVQINGAAFSVVGVAPEDFTGTSVGDPTPPDFWAPVSMQATLFPSKDWLHDPAKLEFQLLARLKSSVSMQHAESQVDGLIRQFASTFKTDDRTLSVGLQHTALLGNTEDLRFQALAAALMLVVGIVLLAAGVNLANMLFARASSRRREISTHLALGASRARLIRKIVLESVLISIAGGAASLLLASWATSLLSLAVARFASRGLPEAFSIQLDFSPDYRVFAYAIALSLAAGLLCGLWPALRFTRADLTAALKGSRVRHVLVVAQVGGSMLLLITAGLLTRGLLRSQSAEPGFETRGLYFLIANFGGDPANALPRRQRLLDQLRNVPEVTGVTVGSYPMMGTWTPPILVEPSSAAGGSGPVLRDRTLGSYVTESYFETLGLRLLRGRLLTKSEVESSAAVAVISESAARRLWPSVDPVGRRFKLDMDFRGKLQEFEVIGIVGDVRFANLTRKDPSHVYIPPKVGAFEGTLVRVSGLSKTGLQAIRRKVEAVDPALMPDLTLLSFEDGPLLMQKRLAEVIAMFAAILASLALTLAGIGIYGVMAFLVAEREKEIGIRMAIGASASGVLRSVILTGLRGVFIGIVTGGAGATALSFLLHATLSFPGSADYLYGVPFYDPPTFLALSGFVTVLAAVASTVPARRALRVDPMITLRVE